MSACNSTRLASTKADLDRTKRAAAEKDTESTAIISNMCKTIKKLELVQEKYMVLQNEYAHLEKSLAVQESAGECLGFRCHVDRLTANQSDSPLSHTQIPAVVVFC